MKMGNIHSPWRYDVGRELRLSSRASVVTHFEIYCLATLLRKTPLHPTFTLAPLFVHGSLIRVASWVVRPHLMHLATMNFFASIYAALFLYGPRFAGGMVEVESA